MNRRFEGKIAIVTGGSQGIGKAVALRLAQEGASVVISNRTLWRGEKVRDEILSFGGRALAIAADISSLDNLNNLVEKTLEIYGKIDILVNNAGLLVRSSCLDTNEEIWNEVINTNLKGTFFLSQLVAKSMIKNQNSGRIINMTSIDGEVVYYHGHHAVYGISKAGIIMMTKQLAIDLAPYNILVNAVAPGVIITEISSFHSKDDPHAIELLKEIPLKQFGKTEDIAGAVAFLASEDANYITGTTLFVDGGWTIH